MFICVCGVGEEEGGSILPTTHTPYPVLSFSPLFKSLEICCDAMRKTRCLLQPKVALLVK